MIASPIVHDPFKFYLVHEQQPNAFATPGGNVYVTDSLMYFVKNTEQLAGTLCHEVSHTIHHDSMNLIEKERQVERREIGAAVLPPDRRASDDHLRSAGECRRQLLRRVLDRRRSHLFFERRHRHLARVRGGW